MVSSLEIMIDPINGGVQFKLDQSEFFPGIHIKMLGEKRSLFLLGLLNWGCLRLLSSLSVKTFVHRG